MIPTSPRQTIPWRGRLQPATPTAVILSTRFGPKTPPLQPCEARCRRARPAPRCPYRSLHSGRGSSQTRSDLVQTAVRAVIEVALRRVSTPSPPLGRTASLAVCARSR
ncbi:hypothetical protein NDU88_003913 [Pleurodeles waltl]|uniref:Uncharacterized protein n=1 Tax=Pleurodeles waltl TaxID=8319 RepID=A0AAV7MSZ9_PLEWA|nr:hypothetical protein NDU88_003912 [Pleurodeles waltl]KAJ1106512.1 hypothetical protein NDU88_003913 [Pleurodeles waltl]